MSEVVYLNGTYVTRADARVSPDDRGFFFADGIYEVIKFYDGRSFRMKDHTERLCRSLSEIGIIYPDYGQMELISKTLIDENNLHGEHAGVYFQVTRGVYKRVHFFPEDIEPTVYAFAFNLPSFTENLDVGIRVIVQEDIRWKRCDIKSISLLPNTMLFNKANKERAGEAILVRDGVVTEATHSTVLGVKDGVVYTHPLSNLILPGITRKVVAEICEENNIPFKEEAFTEEEMYQLDELMIAGTGSEVMPVVQVNGSFIGNKKPGPLTRLLQQKFFEKV